MDRSGDATFPTLGVTAVVPTPGNDGNGLLNYNRKNERQRERQKTVPLGKQIQIFQSFLMTFKGTFFCGNVIVSPWYSLALQTGFLTFSIYLIYISVIATSGNT